MVSRSSLHCVAMHLLVGLQNGIKHDGDPDLVDAKSDEIFLQQLCAATVKFHVIHTAPLWSCV